MNTAQEIYTSNHGDREKVRQDKATPGRSYLRTIEPHDAMIEQQPRHKHHGSQNRKGREAAGYLTNEEFKLIETWKGTGKHKLTRMTVVTDLIRKGIAATLDNQHAAMLEPRIERTITKVLTACMNRTDALLAKLFYTVEQMRILQDKQLLSEFGSDLKDVLVKDAAQTAHGNILGQKMGGK